MNYRFGIAVVCITILLLSGCGVSVSKTSSSTANQAVNELTYAQDARTGLCYATISTSSATHVNDQGMTITWVPCEPKVLEQIKKQ
jgi:uncharacterized protein YceK